MEIIIQTEILKKTINAIQSICQKKTISDITQNFEIEFERKNAYIKATDLEVYVELNIEVEEIIQTTENKKAIINSKLFYEIIKDIDEQYITIILNNKNCIIKSLHSNIELNIISDEEFPRDKIQVENILKINNKNIISSINYCNQISQSNIEKTTHSNILFQFTNTEFKATATDGHCLAHIRIETNKQITEEEFSFLISKKAATDCKKIIETTTFNNEEIFIGKSNTKIIFSNSKFIISIKTMNEKFPNYQKLINCNYTTTIECNASLFIKTTKRLSLFTEKKFIPAIMNINLEKQEIKFKINNTSLGKIEEELKIETFTHESQEDTEQTINISIFPPYIVKAAQETQDENNKITIKIKQQQKPILFNLDKENSKHFFLVMPMIEV